MMRLFWGLLMGVTWSLSLLAQCPNEWAQQISAPPNGTLGGQRLTVAVDGDGNAFISNVISNAQSIAIAGQTYSGFSADALNNSAYVAKIQSDGQFSWAKILEGNGLMSILDIVNDEEGNVYLAGYLTELLSVDTVEIAGPGAYRPGYFIMKMDDGGNLLWYRSTDWPNSRCSAVDWTPEGLAFGIAYSDSISIGGEVFYETPSISSNHQDVLFGLINEDGILLSAYNIGGSGDIDISSLKCNDSFCVLQGKFSDQLSYSGIVHNTSGSLHFSLYQMSLSYQGEVNWSNASVNSDQLTVLSQDMGILSSGDAFFSGAYGYSSLTLDNLTLAEPAQTPSSFLGKVNGLNGSVMPLLEIPSNGQGWNKSLTTNGHQVWFGGGFDSIEFAFGEAEISNSESGTFDGVILSLDVDGNVNCGMGIHGQGDNEIRALEWSESSNLMVLISFNGTVEFGGQTYDAQGNYDLLVIKTCLPCDTLTGVGEVEKEQAQLSIYPNPITAQTQLTYRAPQGAKPTMQLRDMLGRMVKTEQLPSNEGTHTLDVSGLGTGVYFCTLLNGTEVLATQKLSVVKEE